MKKEIKKESESLEASLKPETQAIHGYYNPKWSEGAIKPPLFSSSTWVAKNAEELAKWFSQAYGLKGKATNPEGLIYSRLVNPNLEIFERRMAEFEQAEDSALFSSGMAATTTSILTFLRPGDVILSSAPVYGGTDFLFKKVLPQFGIEMYEFPIEASTKEFEALLKEHQGKVRMVFMESPSNPTIQLADIEGVANIAHKFDPKIMVVVDNTLLGPVFQKALKFGADLTVYSATKMIGGHSDLIAGLAMGSKEIIGAIKGMRTITGTMVDPHTAWLLLRSLETLTIRAEKANKNAVKVAEFLHKHPAVSKVFYPGFQTDKEQTRRYKKYCSGQGSLISFLTIGGKKEAYKVINSLKLINLAVSLGGTESLAEHPQTHTHSDVSVADQKRFGITENMIRLSVGIENIEDIINDLSQALEQIVKK